MNREEYNKNPKLCLQCGKPLSYQQFNYRQKFCCYKCSNLSRPPRSEESKKKTSNTMKQENSRYMVSSEKLHKKFVEMYYSNPKYCVECGKLLAYERRHHKTCCKECAIEYRRKIRVKLGRIANSKLGTNCKKGYYHSIWCDSSWELAFLVYYLDKGFKIERCNEQIEYNYKNEIHKYYPDFILNKNIYIEVKGFEDDKVKYKEESMKRLNKKYHIIRKDVIEKIINKLKQKYEFKNVWDLYEVRVQ